MIEESKTTRLPYLEHLIQEKGKCDYAATIDCIEQGIERVPRVESADIGGH